MAYEELTTVAQLKSDLDITGSTYDTLLGSMLDRAEDLLSDWTGRINHETSPGRWDIGEVTETIPGAMQRSIRVRNWPVDAITSVTVVSSSTASYVMPTNLYRIEMDRRTIRFLGSRATAWEAGLLPSTVAPMNPVLQRPLMTSEAWPYLQVVYEGGYAANRSDVPASLAAAALAVAKQLWFDRKKDKTVQSETLGKHSVTFGSLSPEFVEHIQTMYLRPYMALGIL